MTDPQSGRDGAVDPGRSDGAAGAVQSSLDDTARETTQDDPQSGIDATATHAEKDPADWVTGDEPMTGPQESYLSTLAQQAGEDAPSGLSKADASREIERLQGETGRGQ